MRFCVQKASFRFNQIHPQRLFSLQKEQPKIMETLRVKRLSEHAILPVRATAKAAGYDLSSAYDCEIAPRGKALVKTDLTVAIPDGCYGRVAPRSSLAWKNHIDVGAGVIDSDYRGPLGVVLFNHSEETFHIKRGDRIAQLVLERIATPPVEEVDEIDETVRGSGGFGSTGTNTINTEVKPTN